MNISKDNLDLIAWYLFIRSCHRNFESYGTFKTSTFCRSLLYEVIKVILEKSPDNLHKTDYLDFCRNTFNRLNDQKESDFKDLLSGYFHKDHSSLDFDQLPDELSAVIKMVLNKEEKGKFNCKQIDSYFCNEKTLRDAGMSEDYISELIRVYISLDDEIYVAISGDGESSTMERIKTEISRYSEIFFERRIHVDQNGKKQWVRLQYAHESHWDERNIDHYMNHPFHGKRIPGSSIGLVFFKKNNRHHNIRDLKESFRGQFEDDFPHVHFPDEHREVRWMADAAYNKNTSEWMSKFDSNYTSNFKVLYPEYKKEIHNRTDYDNFCLDTGMVMALHGLRDTYDIDFLSCGKTEKPIVNGRMESHDAQYKNYHKTPQDIIENPLSHFYYKDVKFCSLHEIKDLKLYRSKINPGSINSNKDLKDIQLIDDYLLKLSKNIKLKKDYSVIKETVSLSFGQRFVKTGLYKLLKRLLPNYIKRPLREYYLSHLKRNKTKIILKIPYILG